MQFNYAYKPSIGAHGTKMGGLAYRKRENCAILSNWASMYILFPAPNFANIENINCPL